MRLAHVGVTAGSTKNLAAEITFLGMYITELRSAIGALRCGGSRAGIAVSIFYPAHEDDLVFQNGMISVKGSPASGKSFADVAAFATKFPMPH